MDNQIKESLLKSGIPLESSVVDILQDYQIRDRGEATFFRDGKIHSADIDAEFDIELDENIRYKVNLVIECKYKTDNHNWFFFGFPMTRDSGRVGGIHLTFDSYLDRITENYEETSHIQHSGANSVRPNLEHANKGVDIVENDGSNPEVIRKAVSQASFGAIQEYKESMEYITEVANDIMIQNERTVPIEKKDELAWGCLGVLSLPLVVTNAPIYHIDEETSLQDVRNTNRPEDLFEEVKGVILHNPDRLITKDFTRNLFSEENFRNHEDAIKVMRCFEPRHKWSKPESSINTLKKRHPSEVFVVNYYHLEEVLESIFESLEENLDVKLPEDIPEH